VTNYPRKWGGGMRRSKRFEILENKPVNQDSFINEWPEKGFTAMLSPFDPEPSIRILNGIIMEMDGKKRKDFDFIDTFIADYAINVKQVDESMNMDTVDIARMMVDINVDRKEVIKIFTGLTPAKITRVMNELNVVEMMMAMQKVRARKTPSNQAHITNVKDNPVQIAADAAEGAFRGFREEETTVGVARYAPFNAIALLIGAQVGKRGVLTQCAVEEATELELGMRGFTTYAETMSVYGTESVFVDGDDTPYSKAFLASAYASRGLKTRFTSGTGSEVLMGNAEGKSMLYLETRCLMVTKGAGVQGIQNGSVSCIGITSSVPSGIRAVLAENLIASCLDLEVASSNDQTFTHSDMRRTARTMMQFLPGTDFIFSGYSGTPNYDNMFAGSNFDAEDFDDYNVLQRDLMVDGGLRPVKEEEVVNVRYKAAKVMQALFKELGLSIISDEEVEAAAFAHGSKDMPPRNELEDFEAIEKLMSEGITGIDIVKALVKTGHNDVAHSILNMLKQRITGDYLHTSAILDEDFNVNSAVNNINDYQGPGTGYRVQGKRWQEIQNIPNIIDPDNL
jgi:glycerol dehydratase large subunit